MFNNLSVISIIINLGITIYNTFFLNRKEKLNQKILKYQNIIMELESKHIPNCNKIYIGEGYEEIFVDTSKEKANEFNMFLIEIMHIYRKNEYLFTNNKDNLNSHIKEIELTYEILMKNGPEDFDSIWDYAYLYESYYELIKSLYYCLYEEISKKIDDIIK